MRRRLRSRTAKLAALPLITLVAAGVAATSTTVAQAQETIQCRASAPFFTVESDGDLFLLGHREPETGATSWDNGGLARKVGGGWSAARPVAGPDGRLYSADSSGELRRFRWTGNGWEKNPTGGDYTVIDHGWARYQTSEYFNRMTIDEVGRFYTVEPDGNLHVRAYDEQQKSWQHRILDQGWNQYNLIVAAGNGVLYARTGDGKLYRFRYHSGSQRWLEYRQEVGTSWNSYRQLASAGSDVLYGNEPGTGSLRWHRFLEATDSWSVPGNPPQSGRPVGNGWGNLRALTANPDSCKLVDEPGPAPVTVPLREDAPNAMVEAKDGRLHHFYVDNLGRLAHGRQRGTDNITIIDYGVLTGYGAFAESPAAVSTDEGIAVAALSQDGELRGSGRTNDAAEWPPIVSIGGWTAAPMTFVHRHDGRLRGFLMDSAGCLWETDQRAVGTEFLPWRKHGCDALAQVRPMVAQAANDSYHLTLLREDGRYQTIANRSGVWGDWAVLGGQFSEEAATVVNGGRLHVFARDGEGRILAQVEAADGFPDVWTEIPGLHAVGAPTASVTGAGLVQIAARAGDGYIYVTEQQTPGSSTYRPWERLADDRTGAAYRSATDPVSTTRGNGSVVFSYRDEDGVLYVFKSFTPEGVNEATQVEQPRTRYIGGPAPKQHP